MREDLLLPGVLLATGGAAVLVAAGLPALYPVWTARGVDAVAIIADNRGSWQVANWLFAAGAVLTLAGLGALTGPLDRHSGAAPAVAALALMVVASTLWLANLAFRLTATVRIADASRAGRPLPDWYEPVSAWVGGLWSVAALSGALALVGFGLSVTGGGVLPAWTGWLAVGNGSAMLALYAVTRDVPPFLLYVAPLVFGVAGLVRAAAGPG